MVGSWVTYGLGARARTCRRSWSCTTRSAAACPKGYAQNWGPGSCRAPSRAPRSSPGRRRSTTSPPADLADDRQQAAARPAAATQRRRCRGEPELAARIESVRAGVPDADGGPGSASTSTARPRRRTALYGIDDQALRPLRPPVPDGPPAGRARRARSCRSTPAAMENERSWDGHIDIHGNHTELRRRDRSADRRAADRPEAAAACSTRRWSSGAASSAACRSPRRGRSRAATTTRTPSPSGWPAAASRAARYGATDEIGYEAVENRVSVHDLHATILHLLGMDHERLTYRYNGRDFRLTDVAAAWSGR